MFFYYLVWIFILGLTVGSFLNVCIYRIPRKLNVAKGRSFCPNCKTTIHFYHNVPIVSFILLEGRCKYCKTKISFRYPLVELICGISYTLIFLSFRFSYLTILYCLFASCLLTLSFIDMDTQEIPDTFHVLILLLSIVNLLLSDSVQTYLIGFLIVSLPMFLIASFTNGFGGGDIKLMAASGLLLGSTSVLIAFFIAIFLASALGLFFIMTKKKDLKSKIAFGPYLSLGLFISMLAGDKLLSMYLSLWR